MPDRRDRNSKHSLLFDNVIFCVGDMISITTVFSELATMLVDTLSYLNI